MKTIYICIVLCIISTIELSAYRAPDSCLKIIFMTHPYTGDIRDLNPNPDSVRADSCISSPTFGHRYAKKTFKIELNVQIFNWISDSIINDKIYTTWQDVLPQYDTLKSAFKKLDSLYGTYTFYRVLPKNINDTTRDFFKYQPLSILFDNYVSIPDVVAFFYQLPNRRSAWYNDATIPITGIEIQSQCSYEKTVRIGNVFFKVPLLTNGNIVKFYSLYGSEVYSKIFTEIEQIDLPTDIPIGLYYIQINNFTVKYFHNQKK
ncbi:MAG TPA: hypothetical protein PLI74_12410 [Candidatus Kapabacteria bacterium]|jgi:hypothetical protein|nr:hypothetical protein [Candidatus Kapabacteria bacterium]